jgi:hypothetical protein
MIKMIPDSFWYLYFDNENVLQIIRIMHTLIRRPGFTGVGNGASKRSPLVYSLTYCPEIGPTGVVDSKHLVMGMPSKESQFPKAGILHLFAA